jgi:transmembrane sensor
VQTPVVAGAIADVRTPSLAAHGIDVASAERRLLERLGMSGPRVTDTVKESRSSTVRVPAQRPFVRRSLPVLGALAAAVVVWAAGPRVWKAFSPSDVAVVTQEYVTAYGERKSVDLPDGSRVVLASRTHLRYSEDGHGTRTLDLVGHAVVSVVPHVDRAFMVRTGGVSTRVLGTTFSVQRYANDVAARVAVIDGKVASGNVRSNVVLSAGMVGLITDSSATPIAGGDASAETTWMDGQLQFTRTPVSEMLKSLERWYGYEFRLADSTLATQHVTAAIIIGTPLPKTLQYLKDLLDVRATVNGKVVTLHRFSGREPFRRPVRKVIPSSSEIGK